MRAHEWLEAQRRNSCKEHVLVYRIETEDGRGMYRGADGPKHGNRYDINPCTDEDYQNTFPEYHFWEFPKFRDLTVMYLHGFESLLHLYRWMDSDFENIRATVTEQSNVYGGLFIRVYMLPADACLNMRCQTIFNPDRKINVATLDVETAIILIQGELYKEMEKAVA